MGSGRSTVERANDLVDALTSPIEGDGTTLKEVVSNLDATAGRGRSRGFRVGGSLSGIEGDGVNIAAGGGGTPGTLGGRQAVAGVKGLKKAKRGRGVRGRVRSVKALAKVRGQLKRSEVLAVIAKHMGRIQGCYERALMGKPDLSGKITFEWVVKEDGRVGNARERSSTLGSPKVSACILKIIRKMRFPKPRGGKVTISYPFIFRSAS